MNHCKRSKPNIFGWCKLNNYKKATLIRRKNKYNVYGKGKYQQFLSIFLKSSTTENGITISLKITTKLYIEKNADWKNPYRKAENPQTLQETNCKLSLTKSIQTKIKASHGIIWGNTQQ